MPKKKSHPETVEISGSSDKVPDVTRRTVIPPNLPLVYANGFQIALGPLDVRMFLIETSPLSLTEILDKHVLAVVMTPEALKLLANNLPDYVTQYEKQFGKIREVPISKGIIKMRAPDYVPTQAEEK